MAELIDPFDQPEAVAAPPKNSAPVDNGGLVDPFDQPAEPVPMPVAQQDQGFGARLQSEIEAAPRQVGLTGRYMLEGPAEFLSIFTNPITYAMEKITGNDYMTTAELGQYAADQAGLPSPETQTERVVGAGAKIMAPVAGQAAAAGRVARSGGTMMERIAEKLGTAPVSQMTGAAGGGTAGQYTQETGGGPMAQFAASLAGGFAGAGIPMTGQKAYNLARNLYQNLRGANTNIGQINDRLGQLLAAEGVDISDVPQNIRNSMAVELKRAADTGGDIDPAAMRRLAEYAKVGAVPTRGSVTLDPVQITQEKNLAKYGANSADENLQAMVHRQRNNDMRLTQNLNEMGADQADDVVIAGQKMKSALQAIDAPRKAKVDQAYQQVRDSAGRYAKMDVPKFSQLANDALDEQMLGKALPSQARELLNDVSSGKIPLNVNTMAQLDSRLSGIRRTAYSQGDNEAALAVQTVRQALWNTPPDSAAGAKAMQQYQRARELAAQRFKAIEGNPAMEAALDDAEPDKFVQNFLLGSSDKKAGVRKVRALARDLREMPETFQAARQQILYHLKNKALSGNADETGNFSPSAFRRAMDQIGREKLKLFFTEKEIGQLDAVKNVAAYEKFQPTGSAVNNSNTAAQTLSTLIERVGENALVAKVPVIRALGSFMADQSRAQTAKQSARQALNPGFATPPQRLPGPPAEALTLPAVTGLAAE